MTRRRRPLHPDERDLWARVAATARPLHPDRPERPATVEAHPATKKASRGWPAFQVGEKARTHTAPYDLAPADPLATQPVRMDRRTFERMTRGKLAPEARIDLHGMTLAEAHSELVRFLLKAQATGVRLALVITGKGRERDDRGPIPERTGLLRRQVPQWLRLPPLGSAVLQVAQASQRHGGAGAFYVYLRR